MIDRTLIRQLQASNAELAKCKGVKPDFIETIQAVNFRNFPNKGTINFKSQITAIVGKNGTGKSTVLFLAGCAYAPPVEEGKTKTEGKTFNDFVPDTQKDIMPEGSEYGFIYMDKTDHRYKWHERKKGDPKRKGSKTWDRRGNKTPRKLKQTIFVGFEKTISNGLLLKDYYNLSEDAIKERLEAIGKEEKQLKTLSKKVLETINKVTGKNYSCIQRRLELIR